MTRLAVVRLGLVVLTIGFSMETLRAQESIDRKPFGKVGEQTVHLYTLKNAQGMEVDITNYGGIITRWTAPDKDGKYANVVLGFDTLEKYLAGHPYFGAIIGRYANRIAQGAFTLGGKKYTLATNNGPNHLHGGKKGFDKVVWDVKEIKTKEGQGLELTYLSKDGEEGYPGNLKVKVTYVLTRNNELRIDYHASTDKATPVNLTNHSYFNLAGEGNGDILGHLLTIRAEKFVPVDENLIPLGKLQDVAGTPFDFRKPTAIGARIQAEEEQLKRGKGYDHTYSLWEFSEPMRMAGRVEESTTGRILEIMTTEPGVQLYTGNFLDGKEVGPSGKAYKHRSGFCLETHRFPDGPNQKGFPKVILQPGQEFHSTTVHRFTTSKK